MINKVMPFRYLKNNDEVSILYEEYARRNYRDVDVILDTTHKGQYTPVLEAQYRGELYNKATGRRRTTIREGQYLLVPRMVFDTMFNRTPGHGLPYRLDTYEYEKVLNACKLVNIV